MAKPGLWPLIAILALAACDDAGGFASSPEDSPFAPSGVDPSGESVDGLIVGHRLMAAGEYELAIRAYARAAGEQGMTVDVLSAVGSANLKLGRLGQAERLLRQAIEEDEDFAPAWNNLGVVLMEKGEYGEASRVFRTAFALDSGQSVEIRDNLRLALARIQNPEYPVEDVNFALVRRGPGEFLLLPTP
jgi:tetratricopeptide (TPR) repeat protein